MIKFYVNEKKKTVVCVINDGKITGVAKLHKGDKWSEKTGKIVALHNALFGKPATRHMLNLATVFKKDYRNPYCHLGFSENTPIDFMPYWVKHFKDEAYIGINIMHNVVKTKIQKDVPVIYTIMAVACFFCIAVFGDENDANVLFDEGLLVY